MINKRNAQIYYALIRTIKHEQETPWEDIVHAVKQEIVISNWMEVRGVLQFLISNKVIKRTNSIEVEHYVRLR